VGAGVQLSPNAVKSLRWLGVEADLTPQAVAPEAIELRRARGDRLLARQPLGGWIERRHGAPYWHVLRADLHRVLLAAAEAAGAQVRLGERVYAVEALDADIVVAADGVRSATRAALAPEVPPARFTGQTAWRGTVPFASLPPHAQPPVASVRIGPGRHFVSYRVARGAAVNFVGVVEQADWTAEGWSVRGTRSELAADFAGWPAPVQAIIASCETPWRWAVLDRHSGGRRVLGGESRVVTLGDAAQPVPPFLAQGAAMALEDAVVLARSLADREVDRDTQLMRYEAARTPRATRVLRASRRNGWAFHASEPLAGLGQAALRAADRLAPGALGRSLDWLYGYDSGAA
jgi:salicylate hydroxylase